MVWREEVCQLHPYVSRSPAERFPERRARRFRRSACPSRERFSDCPTEDFPGLLLQGVDQLTCLTFDDGSADNYEVSLGALEKFGIKATFFLIPGLLGGKLATQFGDQPLMEVSQAREIAALGHEIGAHTMTTPIWRIARSKWRGAKSQRASRHSRILSGWRSHPSLTRTVGPRLE